MLKPQNALLGVIESETMSLLPKQNEKKKVSHQVSSHEQLFYIFLGFRKSKSKDEKTGLNDAPVSVEDVSVCKSILVTCISDNTTHDAIELFFESRRNNGGPVEKVDYVEKSGRAVVVFQDEKGL